MIRRAGFALVSLAVAGSAWGTVANERMYRFGENDPPHAVGAPGLNPTVDSVSAANAMKIGLEFYHHTSGGGPPLPLGIAPGSTEAMEFTNIDSRYVAAAFPATTNYGLEVYVQPQVNTDALFFYDGGPGFPGPPPADGMGLGIQGGQYVGFVGTVGIIPSGVSATPGQPVEIAIVADGGATRLFVQGVQKGPVIAAPLAVGGAETLSMGNFFVTPPQYAGVLDEARVFDFIPGQFNPGDLGPAAVPEPGVIGLVGAMTVLALRRRSSRA